MTFSRVLIRSKRNWIFVDEKWNWKNT